MYHLSHTWKQRQLIVKPRIQTRVPEESNIPRICVCPTVAQCIAAIGAYMDCPPLLVYSTDAPSIPSENVFDAHLTGERWIIKEAFFTYTGITIDPLILPEFDLCNSSDAILLKRISKAISAFNIILKGTI